MNLLLEDLLKFKIIIIITALYCYNLFLDKKWTDTKNFSSFLLPFILFMIYFLYFFSQRNEINDVNKNSL